MGFYEDIAQALDTEGIESRVNDDMLFVPIAPELEIHFQQIEQTGTTAGINSANVFLAKGELDEVAGIEEFEDSLVGVVFSVEAAVSVVAQYIATDQCITVLHDLLEGTDDRISDLEFEQDLIEPMMVRAEVGNGSLITVLLGSGADEPEATVTFVTFGEDYDELVAQAEAELDSDESLSDFEREVMYQNVLEDAAEMTQEVLELGTFKDFDQLFDALAVAQVQATEWEEMLVPLEDEYEYYDEFGEEDFDEDFDGDEDDDEEDFDDDYFDDGDEDEDDAEDED
ncbi:hypothetical protein [uncultured Corynebacterium sp.]|uniref:hypothetical protein n=1 Tax=uncultured Corynebacterium sp. TaxID=159447 RepID=UPI0025F93E11|nr:hypothetical protein [uncultured Corynebacterium sp.]